MAPSADKEQVANDSKGKGKERVEDTAAQIEPFTDTSNGGQKRDLETALGSSDQGGPARKRVKTSARLPRFQSPDGAASNLEVHAVLQKVKPAKEDDKSMEAWAQAYMCKIIVVSIALHYIVENTELFDLEESLSFAERVESIKTWMEQDCKGVTLEDFAKMALGNKAINSRTFLQVMKAGFLSVVGDVSVRRIENDYAAVWKFIHSKLHALLRHSDWQPNTPCNGKVFTQILVKIVSDHKDGFQKWKCLNSEDNSQKALQLRLHSLRLLPTTHQDAFTWWDPVSLPLGCGTISGFAHLVMSPFVAEEVSATFEAFFKTASFSTVGFVPCLEAANALWCVGVKREAWQLHAAAFMRACISVIISSYQADLSVVEHLAGGVAGVCAGVAMAAYQEHRSHENANVNLRLVEMTRMVLAMLSSQTTSQTTSEATLQTMLFETLPALFTQAATPDFLLNLASVAFNFHSVPDQESIIAIIRKAVEEQLPEPV